MTTKQIEMAIENQYDNGRYMSLGADGGVLKYAMINVYGKWYRASITLDSELSEIRRIWELSEVTKDNVKIKNLYDFTDNYYSYRNI